MVRLRDVRRRLELWVGAVGIGAARIVIADPPARPSWIGRIAMRVPRHLVDLRALAGTDGVRIRLPRALPATHGEDAALADYRLLALQQAVRIERGTAQELPHARSALERDLYLLREARAVDHCIAEALPGLRHALHEARKGARTERPANSLLTPSERAVEALVLDVLHANALVESGEIGTPAQAMQWARQQAEQIRSLGAVQHRGVRAVGYWGRTQPPPDVHLHAPRVLAEESGARTRPERVHELSRAPTPRVGAPDEDDDAMGMWMIQLDDPQEHAEDPMGLQRPTDRDDSADPGALADSLSELPEVRVIASQAPSPEVLLGDEPPPRIAVQLPKGTTPTGIRYPEWDYRTTAYRPDAVIVGEASAPTGDPAWAETVRARFRQERQEIRRRFERLRPVRVRRGRLREGEEVDLSAFLTDYADQRAGCAPDERLYASCRAERRNLAILLLVDTSSSTDAWVAKDKRVIDVEKEAVLLVCEALDALGDRFSVLAFSGEGPEHVRVSVVKAFAERLDALTGDRIAGLDPDGYTRTGAAIRHATSLLASESARHRLLLVLSDGKPNDVDHYEGRYGIEDTRQAVLESRARGLHTFCLTIDREAPSYMPHVFGAAGYAVLSNAARLPSVMLDVLRRLIAS